MRNCTNKMRSLEVLLMVNYMVHARIEKFFRGGQTFFLFFFSVSSSDQGRDDPNTTISRPSSVRQQNAI